MWSGIPGDHCLAAVRQEDYARAPSTRELGVEGGDRRHSRVDAEMLHARAVAEGAAGGDSLKDEKLGL